jgi:RNA polymerase sigma factor (sigma-70 family)
MVKEPPDSSTMNWSALRRSAVTFARLWCSRAPDVEDVAHEALLAYIQHQQDVRDPLHWLFIVTRRQAMRLLMTEQPSSLSDSGPCLATAGNRCECQADIDAVLRLILRTHALPVKTRRILVLFTLGHTHKEIALRLGCSRADVGQLLSRALKRASQLRSNLLADD